MFARRRSDGQLASGRASVERLAEERDRGRDARDQIAGDAEPEQDLGAVESENSGPRRARAPRPAGRARCGPRRSASAPRPRRRAAGREARRLRSPRPARARGVLVDRALELELLGERLGPGERSLRRVPARHSRPRSRGRSTSTPSRTASHSTVSGVGRVFPRSIWEMYSFEKRSPARSDWVSPADDPQLAQPVAPSPEPPRAATWLDLRR